MPKIKKLKTPLSVYLPCAVRQAVADIRAVRKDPRYSLNMRIWHSPGAPCKVCLAGAVVARRTNTDSGSYIDWGSLSHRMQGVLCALDYLRRGLVQNAADMTGYVLRRDPPAWAYRSISSELESTSDYRFERGCQHLLKVADWLEKNEAKAED